MGYTNYWYQTRSFTNEEWNKICVYCETLLKNNDDKAYGCPITDFDENGDEYPLIVIDGSPNCETFKLRQFPTNEFNFCKTQQLPYDQVVWGLLKYIKEEVVGLNKSEFRIVNDNGEEIV